MARVKTFAQAGRFFPHFELNEIQDDYEGLFSGYTTLMAARGSITNSTSGAKVIPPFTIGQGTTAIGIGSAATAQRAHYLVAGDYAAGSRTTKLRVISGVLTANNWPGGISFTIGLHAISAWGGASGAAPFISTLATAISGSTTTYTTPGINARLSGTSADFNFPATDYYVLGVNPSATVPSNVYAVVWAELQMRRV